MKCVDVLENLEALLDDEGESISINNLRHHIETCRSCGSNFKHQQALRACLKRILPVSAAASLDEKVFSAFQAFHDRKQAAIVGNETRIEKIGWLGIPRFAFAAAMVLFALTAISAFQLGKMTAGELIVVMPEAKERSDSPDAEPLQMDQTISQKPVAIKIVEVPVIQEKIIRVPVISEKIITKTIYVDKKVEGVFPKKNSLALKSSVKNNGYLTQVNLTGFQPVSDLNLTIRKEEKNDEK